MIINSAKYSCAAGHEINEDSCLCSTEKGIFIVADGLGGHSDGEKASLAAVDYFEENYRGGCSNELISRLMEDANTEVLQKGDGGKTTVAAAFIENGHFFYANAGDSRVYFFRDDRIIAQTKDHSVCQASVDMGMIRPEDIRGNEDRSRLLKVLGSDEKLNIKKAYPPIRIQNGDAFLICSDGFWDYVYEAEMEADLLKSDNSEVWLKYMLKRHILRAENKGDNYTAICGIIYLDGSESFELPAGETAQAVSDNNGSRHGLVPMIIAGVAVIAAAVGLSVFLRGGNTSDDEPQISETIAVSTSDETSQTETSSETAATTESTTITTTETASDTDTVSDSTTITTTETTSDTDIVSESTTITTTETASDTDTIAESTTVAAAEKPSEAEGAVTPAVTDITKSENDEKAIDGD